MKVAPVVGLLVIVSIIEVAYGRPVDQPKVPREASVYVLGNLYNAAVSHNFSKSQAASDRNESEWNNTEMLNGVHNDKAHDEEEMARGGVLIYAGGDAANLAVSYDASESQAAENDQKSGYNNQNLGMGEAENEEVEHMEEDEKKK